MADPPKLPPRPAPKRDPRAEPEEHTPLVDVPHRGMEGQNRPRTAPQTPSFGNVPVPPGAFGRPSQPRVDPPAPPPPPPPTQAHPFPHPQAQPPHIQQPFPQQGPPSSQPRPSFAGDFVLSSMLPPRLSDLDDDVEQTRVGNTVVGAPAYRPQTAPARKTAYLTVMAGARAGEVLQLVNDETILGRGPQSTVHLDSDGVSRKHARIVKQGDDFILEDLGSTNGTWIDEQRIKFRKLNDGDRIQIGTEVIVRFTWLDEMEASLQQQLYESAHRDPLTRAYNRKHFQERMRSEIGHALRHRGNLSLIMLDIDHFKRINDGHGHPAGDAVLKAISGAIQKAIRVEDVFARIGGEEFALLARGIDAPNAVLFAERLRRGIERLPIPWQNGSIPVTSSFGVATLTELYSGEAPKTLDGDLLVAKADQRLYQAKTGGRNRVVGPV